MNKSFSIQLRAAFLLVVFSLNTMSGFACALGLDMSFGFGNIPSVSKADARVVQEKQSCHSGPRQAATDDGSDAENKTRDCCGDKMIRFDKLDKTVVKSLTITNPVFLNGFVSTFFDVEPLSVSRVATNIKYPDRSHHLPVPDIRVMIRSFQV